MISLSGIENVISIAWVIYILFVNKVKLEIETSFWTLYVKDNFNRYTKNGNKHIYLHLLTYTTQVHAVKNSHLYVHQTADLQIPWGDILLAEATCLLTDPPTYTHRVLSDAQSRITLGMCPADRLSQVPGNGTHWGKQRWLLPTTRSSGQAKISSLATKEQWESMKDVQKCHVYCLFPYTYMCIYMKNIYIFLIWDIS